MNQKKRYNLNTLEGRTESDEGKETTSDKVKVRVASGNEPFYIKEFSKIYYFKITDTIKTVKKEYIRLYDADSDDLEDVKLYVGKGLALNNRKLLTYATYIPPEKCYVLQVFIQFNVRGGSGSNSNTSKVELKEDFFDIKQKPKYRQRNINHSNKNHKFSNGRCVISYEKDAKNNVFMPCKHTINSQSMFRYLLRTFNKNDWQYEIYCPVSKCNTKWDFAYCAKVACLNTAEWLAFDEAIIKRSKAVTKKCPHCKKDCEKSDFLNYYRISCVCSRGDWCWDCGKKWIGGGLTVCGNKGCITEFVNNVLKNCGYVQKAISDKFKTPRLRACPFCHKVTEHASECKHMSCRGCKKDFCFVCLKGKNSKGKWLCSSGDSYLADCGVAPIQVLK